MTAEAPPDDAPFGRLVVALLLLRQLLDLVRVEGCLADVVRQALAGHQVALAHFVAPPPSRMRGSSIASSTSETKQPITTSPASNLKIGRAACRERVCQ